MMPCGLFSYSYHLSATSCIHIVIKRISRARLYEMSYKMFYFNPLNPKSAYWQSVITLLIFDGFP